MNSKKQKIPWGNSGNYKIPKESSTVLSKEILMKEVVTDLSMEN
jgi:hypothetical protein